MHVYITALVWIFVIDNGICVDDNQLTFNDLFEGDITGVTKKNLHRIISEDHDWREGIIPYTLDRNLDFTTQRGLSKSIRIIRSLSCVQFVPKQRRHSDFIHFKAGNHCSSYIGRRGGGQELVLGPKCETVGQIIHLLMHAMGFWHENSRTDRDRYLLINWKNIQSEMRGHFQSYTSSKSSHYGVPFDYKSIMLMPSNSYAIDSSTDTILSKDERYKLGRQVSLSQGDINKIQIRYCGKEPIAEDGTEIMQNIAVPRAPLQLISAGRQSVGCYDQSIKCPLWATQGHCYQKQTFMREQCPESCLLCQGGSPCRDNNTLCGVWAWLGRCTQGNSVRLTLRTCPLSCSVCLPIGSTEAENTNCDDYHRDCSQWAANGRCFYQHILKLCPKSCNICGRLFEPRDRAREEVLNCYDHSSYRFACKRWLEDGLCSISVIRRHCRKSCHACTKRKAFNTTLNAGASRRRRCTDSHLFCKFVRGFGDLLCMNDVLKRVCADSCGVCAQ